MNSKIKLSKNPLESIFYDLKMFEQTQYCLKYMRNIFFDKNDDEIMNHAEIASSCFRQANEYYKAASIVSLSTNPLLYSYALNNFAKGIAYLLYFDKEMLKYFKDHGFYILDDYIRENILETNITIKQSGVPTFILKLFNNTVLKKQEISFELLLSQIPEISNIFNKTTLKMSNIAIKIPNTQNEFQMYVENFEDIKERKDIFNEYGITGNYNSNNQTLNFYFNMIGQKKIENDIIKNNLFYKEYLILPNKFIDGICTINLMFYCYLLIMSYGMLVRYNAHKWENFIDPKISKESTLIAMSVDVCVNDFLTLLHQKLLGYTYVEDKYDDYNVKRVINDSTADIMNNITKKIKDRNLQYNSNDLLPWSENYR